MSASQIDGFESYTSLLVFGFVRECTEANINFEIPREVTKLIESFFPPISCVAIDNGSGYTKCGLARSAATHSSVATFPSIVGQQRHSGVMVGMPPGNGMHVGERALAFRGILALRYPVEHGLVTSWDYMEKIWHHSFYEKLCIQPEDYYVLQTEKPQNPKANREKVTQIMFETFNVLGMYLAIDAVLALYATGRLTGCVVDSGDGVTHCVPVYEGHAIQTYDTRFDHAGRDLTDYFIKILAERGYSFTTSAEREIARDIKETLCYVASDYEAEMGKYEVSSEFERTYELPSGQAITFGNERFRAAEPLFNPCHIGCDCQGLNVLIDDTIRRCTKEIQPDLYGNILLSGGSMMFPGMADRVKKEVMLRAPASMEVNVIDVEHKNLLSWIGGSMFASTAAFLNMCITKDEYDEFGPGIVHRKCF